MPVDVPFITKFRYEKLLSHRRTYEPLWQELADYLLPRKNQITSIITKGQKQTTKVFDSTGEDAARLLASALHGHLTSAASRWFRLKIRQAELNEVDEVQDWQDVAADRLYAAKEQSNFAQELDEAYQDLCVFGTAAVLLEARESRDPGFGGLLYRTLPIASYVVDENAEGRVDTLFRTFEMSARALVARWGLTKVGKRIAESYTGQDMDRLFTILHGVYPRTDARPKRNPRARDLPWASCYIDLEGQHLIHESGVHEFPFLVPRWSKASGEMYGRGPGHVALPHVKTLNRYKELHLQALGKVVNPSILAKDDGVIGSIKLTAGGVTIVRDMEALRPFESGARFDVGGLEVEKMQRDIRRIFFSDLTSYPPLTDSERVTATEILDRRQTTETLLSPMLGRLQAELLNADIERSFGLMLRGRAIPAPPEILLRSANDLDIEYQGPLARAQRLGDVAAMDRLYQFALGAVEVLPELLDNIDSDEAFRYRAEVLGVPAKILLASDRVAKVRQARRKVQEDAAQQEGLLAASEGAKNLAPALKALPELQGMLGGQPGQGAA
jgi:hypothetical protein